MSSISIPVPIGTTLQAGVLKPDGISITVDAAGTISAPGGGGGGAGALQLIGAQVLAANAPTVSFPSIPQTFNHLLLRVLAFSTAATGDALMCTVNGDTVQANYQQIQWLLGQGTRALAGRNVAPYCPLMNICQISSQSQQPQLPGPCAIDIPGYRSPFNKAFLSMGAGGDLNGIEIQPQISYWIKTDPITSLLFSLFAGGAQFVAGSIFSLYGLQ